MIRGFLAELRQNKLALVKKYVKGLNLINAIRSIFVEYMYEGLRIYKIIASAVKFEVQ